MKRKTLSPEAEGSVTTELTTQEPDIQVPNVIYQFKSKAITDLAQRLGHIAVKAAQESNAYKREIAVTCAKVKLEKDVWKADGFTGIGDFANKTFGIAKSTLSNWLKVANKFYLNPAFADDEVINSIPINNLYEISGLSDKEIKALIEEGKITKSSSQLQLRQLEAEKAPEAEKARPQVVTTYSGTVHMVRFTENDENPTPLSLTEGEFETDTFPFENLVFDDIISNIAYKFGVKPISFTPYSKKEDSINVAFVTERWNNFGRIIAQKDAPKAKAPNAKTNTVSQEDYDKMKEELEKLKAMLSRTDKK